MKFAVYKLNFAAGVHLGTGTLASGTNTLPAHWRSVSVYRRGTLSAETARAGSKGKRGQFHRKEELQEAEIYPGISAGYLFAG